MKKQIVRFLFLLLLLPIVANAEYKIPVIVEGHIGDFAPKSRIYEVNGHFYQLPGNIVIQNRDGERLSFGHLKGGTIVKIIGEKIVGPNENSKILFNKIVIMKK